MTLSAPIEGTLLARLFQLGRWTQFGSWLKAKSGGKGSEAAAVLVGCGLPLGPVLGFWFFWGGPRFVLLRVGLLGVSRTSYDSHIYMYIYIYIPIIYCIAHISNIPK